MRYSAILLAAAAGVSLPACNHPEADTRNTAVLLGSNRSAADTMNTVLIGLQRDLLSGVATGDTAVLSNLLSGSFTAHDVRVAEATPIAPGGETRPLQVSYLEVLSGRLSDAVAFDYDTYQAVPNGESAIVYAFGPDHAVQIEWRYRSARWQASRMIIMRPGDARAMLELAQG